MVNFIRSMKFNEILDAEVETVSPEKLHRKLSHKLDKQLRYVLSKSDFYKNFYKNRIDGLHADNLMEKFRELPFTEKFDIVEDQRNYPPFGRNLCVDYEKIRRIHKTSGTTAKPLFLALTEIDINNLIRTGRRCLWSAGVRPVDLVVHCLNYCLWTGGYTDHQSLEATGAGVIPYGVGNSSNLIQTILDVKPTAIHCTPSYLSKLEILLKDEFNLEPSQLGLKKGFFGGESGLQNLEFRNKIERTWGIQAMNANYGLSDVHSMFGAECTYRCGLHFMGQEYLIPEIIDIKTEVTLPIEKGICGELVLTNLEKEAQPLIRFRTHDVLEILDTERCLCGRTSFRFKVMGRSDDMLIVKGVNVFPSAIGDILSQFLDFLSGEFQIVAPREDPVEKVILLVELNASNSLKDMAKIRTIISENVRHKLDITPEIRLINNGEFQRTEGKTKRLVRI